MGDMCVILLVSNGGVIKGTKWDNGVISKGSLCS